MKKIVLLSLSLSIALFCFSQQRALITKSLRDLSVTREFRPAIDDISANENSIKMLYKESSMLDENVIGKSFYDLQTNGCTQNRIYYYEDGTIGVVWTMGFTSPSFPERGTGYNFFDGNSWDDIPDERIETQRTGWPSYAPWGANGEIVISHSGNTDGIIISKRPDKGTGNWTQSQLIGPAGHEKIEWPRMITSGTDNSIIQLLSVTAPVANGGSIYNGQDGATLYSRSTDGGATWDPENILLDGMGSDYYTAISADEVSWAEPRANTLAFLVSDAWHDMFLMKSTDGGDTWEKTIIWEHPYPLFDWNSTITTDTIWCTDNSAAIALDQNGMAHVVCGLSRVAHTEVGNSYSYWPWTDGVAYWNETMPPFTAPNQHDALDAIDVLIEDYNLIGWTQDVNGNGTINLLDELQSYRELGISTMTNISIDELNRIYVAFASTTETYENGTMNYKHVWFRTSFDNGATWGEFQDLCTDLIHIFDECIFPTIAANSGDFIHLFYNFDPEPGLAIDEDHPYIENTINYVSVEKFGVGIDNDISFTEDNVSQNFPNPFNNTSVVKVTLEYAANLSLEVYNLMGQKVYEVSAGKVNAGSHNLTIDASEINSGIYFYTVKAGENSATKKMIVE